MWFLLFDIALLFVAYHMGIEKGRKRSGQNSQHEGSSVVTKLNEWRR